MAEQKAPPIDRPLSRSYLREFSGWSTAYPPAISEPTSLRIMENISITREGAASIRPGMRSILSEDVFLTSAYGEKVVGSFEHFFLNDGRKAFLFAVRKSTNKIGFRVAAYNKTSARYELKTLPEAGFVIPQGEESLSFTEDTTYVRYVQIDNKIIALSNEGEDMRIFWVGEHKKAKRVQSLPFPEWLPSSMLKIVHPSHNWVNMIEKTLVPTAQTPTVNTLVSSDATKNVYSYAYFYTFFNEVGESAASQVSVIKTQKPFSSWRMLKPDTSGNPTTNAISDPDMAMDQLVATIPVSVFDQAVAAGAVGWSLYAFTWSDQGNVPMEGVKIGTKMLDGEGVDYQTHGWISQTPLLQEADEALPIPSETTRENYSTPPSASQGLVVGDRVVLVYDRQNSAVIRWSSNQMGEYLNFSPSKGGGYKTLTSGNLQVPASVKLWQNPQSVDTITILCTGVDGYSTAYYMSPSASVSGGSESMLVMGFEETTATPGTTSPFGVEVLNNALYHPIDSELMKSTAANYMITHKSMSEKILNKWQALLNKDKIVSSQLDNRLYYLVHNPDGAPLQAGCMGNEIWICDTATEGSWSRWLTQGQALRKIEVGGYLYMALVRPEGFYIFDPLRSVDEAPKTGGGTQRSSIPWRLETNSQGANASHDAWANLQQLQVTFGSFVGSMEYGVRGWNVHGRPVETKKQYNQLNYVNLEARPLPFDSEDYLLVRENMKEWSFFAQSIKEGSVVKPSYGQLSIVQYRFTQASVNVGYEYGSVETFEYARAKSNWGSRTTDNGVPIPVIDTRL